MSFHQILRRPRRPQENFLGILRFDKSEHLFLPHHHQLPQYRQLRHFQHFLLNQYRHYYLRHLRDLNYLQQLLLQSHLRMSSSL